MMDSLETTLDLRRNVFDWDDLQIFHAVATTGSMSAAANALGWQQPTVSKRMRQLEARLGTKLIVRRADGVSLTESGELALDYVKTMQRSAQQLESRVAGADKSPTGTVVLRASDGLATYWLARHMPAFMRVNPGIDLVVENTATASSTDPAPDLAITFTPEKDMDTKAVALGSLHYMPFASREFIQTYGEPASLHEALSLRFLQLGTYNRDESRWGNRVLAVDSYINYSFRTQVSSVLFETLRHGGGIAMAPTFLAELYPEELVVLDYDFTQSVRFWLKYTPESQRMSRTKKVGEWIVDCFDRQINPWFREEFVHPEEFCGIDVIRSKT